MRTVPPRDALHAAADARPAPTEPVAIGHPDERVAVVIGSTHSQGPALRYAVDMARRRGAPLDVVQILDEGDPLLAQLDGGVAPIDPVLHQLSVWGRLHRLAEHHAAPLADVDHHLHVLGVFDDAGRERLLDLLQEVTLTVIGDDSPLLAGTTPEQLALALAQAARCGVIVVPTAPDPVPEASGHRDTRAA